jgi:hypothetical protein
MLVAGGRARRSHRFRAAHSAPRIDMETTMNPKTLDVPTTTRRLPTACAVASLLAALCLGFGATAQAREQNGKDEPSDGRYCSTTASLMNTACGYESKDGFFVAKAKCTNVSNAAERSRCQAEAKQARTDAEDSCRAQYDARLAVCSMLGEGRYDPPFDPSSFDADFRNLSHPNPYFPLGIGHHWEYMGGDERATVDVLDATKLIAGVTCIVVRDLVYVGGQVKEATDDWFAAGRDGSTWYCGEEVKDYETFDGDRPRAPQLVKIDGTFKHGVDGDKAGVIMPAQPRVGQVYLEEFSLGNAEDVSEVLSTSYIWGENAELDRLVPRDLVQRLCNRDCVVTKNITAREPGLVARKYYARGIGFIVETKPDKGESLQLVACNFDPRCAGLPTP